MLETKDRTIEAIIREISLRKDYLIMQPDGSKVRSIYFGGGTPSLLTSEELKKILDAIHSNFQLDQRPEITLEANPDDLSFEKLKELRSLGINRLSIGVQSFYDEDLVYMNRLHTASMAVQAIVNSREAGFENISIDLIYGTPGLSDDRWISNLDKAAELDIQHLSCYALTVEQKTPLASLILKGSLANPTNEQAARQMTILMDWAQASGMEQYEISNFCKPQYRSRHNSSYWSGRHYVGLGPSAHSYNGITRQWNISHNRKYADSIFDGIIPCETEELSPSQRVNERIMVGLRTIEGLSLSTIPAAYLDRIMSDAEPHITCGNLVFAGQHLRLSRQGMLLADKVASDMFV